MVVCTVKYTSPSGKERQAENCVHLGITTDSSDVCWHHFWNLLTKKPFCVEINSFISWDTYRPPQTKSNIIQPKTQVVPYKN